MSGALSTSRWSWFPAAERIADRLDALTTSSQLDDDILLDEIRWFSGLMAAFGRYGEEDFDAVERILSLERD